MRKSRVLLAGVAVAAAAAATSAFTASNTAVGVATVAGYGEIAASGVDVTDMHYNVNATDKSVVEAIVFTTSTDVTGLLATVTLKKKDAGNADAETNIANYPMDCDTPVVAGSDWTITCDTTGHALTFGDFDLVGLTVRDAA